MCVRVIGLDKLDHPWGLLDHPWGLLDHPCGLLDHPWGLLDHPWGLLDHPWGLLDHPWGLLDHPWGLLDHPWGLLDHRYGLADRRCGSKDLRGRVLPRHPRHQRAFHPRRELGHPRERDPVLEDLLVRLDVSQALHQAEELAVDGKCLRNGLADHQVGHHRGRSLADGTTLGGVGHVLHDRIGIRPGQVHPQGDLVPTCGVDVLHLRLERLPQPGMVRSLVVVKDDLLVERVQVLCHPYPIRKYFLVYSNPSMSTSISAGVVYRYDDARVELCTPNRGCAGFAQWWPARTAMPRESSTWLTSCGWMPSISKDMAPPRSAADRGPSTLSRPTVDRASSA